MELKVLLMVLKKKAGVTSRRIAEELGVSVQTVSTMAGHLDQVKVVELCKIADMLEIDRGDFLSEIMQKSTIV